MLTATRRCLDIAFTHVSTLSQNHGRQCFAGKEIVWWGGIARLFSSPVRGGPRHPSPARHDEPPRAMPGSLRLAPDAAGATAGAPSGHQAQPLAAMLHRRRPDAGPAVRAHADFRAVGSAPDAKRAGRLWPDLRRRAEDEAASPLTEAGVLEILAMVAGQH